MLIFKQFFNIFKSQFVHLLFIAIYLPPHFKFYKIFYMLKVDQNNPHYFHDYSSQSEVIQQFPQSINPVKQINQISVIEIKSTSSEKNESQLSFHASDSYSFYGEQQDLDDNWPQFGQSPQTPITVDGYETPSHQHHPQIQLVDISSDSDVQQNQKKLSRIHYNQAKQDLQSQNGYLLQKQIELQAEPKQVDKQKKKSRKKKHDKKQRKLRTEQDQTDLFHMIAERVLKRKLQQQKKMRTQLLQQQQINHKQNINKQHVKKDKAKKEKKKSKKTSIQDQLQKDQEQKIIELARQIAKDTKQPKKPKQKPRKVKKSKKKYDQFDEMDIDFAQFQVGFVQLMRTKRIRKQKRMEKNQRRRQARIRKKQQRAQALKSKNQKNTLENTTSETNDKEKKASNQQIKQKKSTKKNKQATQMVPTRQSYRLRSKKQDFYEDEFQNIATIPNVFFTTQKQKKQYLSSKLDSLLSREVFDYRLLEKPEDNKSSIKSSSETKGNIYFQETQMADLSF